MPLHISIQVALIIVQILFVILTVFIKNTIPITTEYILLAAFAFLYDRSYLRVFVAGIHHIWIHIWILLSCP